MSKSNKVIIVDEESYGNLVRKVDSISESLKSLTLKNNHGLKNNWLTSDEVCIMLNISKRKLQQLRTDKLIQFTKKGKKIYYKSKSLDKYLEQK